MYCKNCGKQLFSTQKPKTQQDDNKSTNNATFVTWIWILAIGLIVSIIVCVTQANEKKYWQSRYNIVNYDFNSQKDELSSINNKLSSTNNELHSIKSELDNLDSPIIISKIEVRNSGEDYNQTIYSSNNTYINGKIYFFSTKTETITLKVKFYAANRLSTGSGNDYHSDYSYSNTVNIYAYKYSTFEFNGWGHTDGSPWPSGDYRYEVWYGDKCIGVKHFKVY
jgi:hypothetical protein